MNRSRRTLALCRVFAGAAVAFQLATPVAAQSVPSDTIRPGRGVRLRAVEAGVDTIDISTRSSDGSERSGGISVVQRVRIVENGESVIRIVGDAGGGSRYVTTVRESDFSPRGFHQITARDSLRIDIDPSGTVSGWIQPQNDSRRTIQERLPESGFLDVNNQLVVALPLAAGFDAMVRHYSPWTGFSWHRVRVVGEELVEFRGERRPTWHAEEIIESDYGTLVRHYWIDKEQPRRLRMEWDFPRGRAIHRTR